MIADALKYLVGIGQKADQASLVEEVDGAKFMRSTGKPVRDVAEWPHVHTRTLQGLVDAVEEIDEPCETKKALAAIALVESPHMVKVMSLPVDTPTGMDRRLVAIAHMRERGIMVRDYIDQETFLLDVMAEFVPGMGDLDAVLSTVQNMQTEAVANVTDDRVAQAINVKSGVRSLEKKVIENPVYLHPFYTFEEVPQPAVGYILRLKGGGKDALPRAGLFPLKRQGHTLAAIESIKDWLRAQMPSWVKVIG